MYKEYIDIMKTVPQGKYTHRHHIIPKSLGGSDDEDNLVELSWTAHYFAHKILAEENPDNKRLQGIFKGMGDLDNWYHHCYMFARDKHGENNSMYGKHHSDEAKAKMSNKAKGRKYSDEVNKKKGRPKTEEQKKHLSEVLTGVKKSEETRRRMSIAFKGHKGAATGKKWYNNGVRETYQFECPDGYEIGRLKKRKD